jgi:hypothetical protein
MKNAIILDLRPCGSCNNRQFWRTYRLYLQGDKNRRAKNNVNGNSTVTAVITIVTANVATSPILVNLLMVAMRSFETSVLKRATLRNIQEGYNIHC